LPCGSHIVPTCGGTAVSLAGIGRNVRYWQALSGSWHFSECPPCVAKCGRPERWSLLKALMAAEARSISLTTFDRSSRLSSSDRLQPAPICDKERHGRGNPLQRG
jgi:hypothetical protein